MSGSGATRLAPWKLTGTAWHLAPPLRPPSPSPFLSLPPPLLSQPSWLADSSTPLCRLSDPLPDPPPLYSASSDEVLAWSDASYSRLAWPLPRQQRRHPNADERAAVFGAALLEGRVLPCMTGGGHWGCREGLACFFMFEGPSEGYTRYTHTHTCVLQQRVTWAEGVGSRATSASNQGLLRRNIVHQNEREIRNRSCAACRASRLEVCRVIVVQVHRMSMDHCTCVVAVQDSPFEGFRSIPSRLAFELGSHCLWGPPHTSLLWQVSLLMNTIKKLD